MDTNYDFTVDDDDVRCRWFDSSYNVQDGSIAVTFRTDFDKSTVQAPVPAPISSTVASLTDEIIETIKSL